MDFEKYLKELGFTVIKCEIPKENIIKEKEISFKERKNKRISAMVSQMSLKELKELEESIEVADRIIERLKY